jgi:23S rRNA pseudouridine1911/1915/1917 synthase
VKNKGWTYTDRAAPSDRGRTIADFYSVRYPRFTEDEWRHRFGDGQISLNGRPAGADDILSAGDLLVYSRPPWEETDVPSDFAVLYEDASVLVLAKPSGLPVFPGGSFLEHTLLHLARQRFGDDCSPLHRLGRGTSGAILFTRNGRSARILSRAMAERRIRKVYLALASGIVSQDAFTVEAPIGPVPYVPLTTVHAFNPKGRPSTSLFRVLERRTADGATLLEVTIPTGRPHQIRIHLSCAGHPLVGDPLYGTGGLPLPVGKGESAAALPGDSGYHLHSWKIRFAHPDTGQDLEVVAPPPPILAPPL